METVTDPIQERLDSLAQQIEFVSQQLQRNEIRGRYLKRKAFEALDRLKEEYTKTLNRKRSPQYPSGINNQDVIARLREKISSMVREISEDSKPIYHEGYQPRDIVLAQKRQSQLTAIKSRFFKMFQEINTEFHGLVGEGTLKREKRPLSIRSERIDHESALLRNYINRKSS